MGHNIDEKVDLTLEACISPNSRKSFFLFAGAGSGKTHSLVRLLNKIKDKWEKQLNLEGRHIAVITYTNAATDEILNRLDYSPLFHVSTIHSFVWEVIKHYQTDIKKCYIAFKEDEKAEIELKLEKSKSKSGKNYNNNLEKLVAINEKIIKASDINRFIYNPNGNNYEYNALSHADVIKIGAKMIVDNELLQKIIAQQYPFFMIDESQDTKKELIAAFFEIERNIDDNFTLGLFGDQKQRIYTDGEERIVEIIPQEWEKPIKEMNYRCAKRIVELANKIGCQIDVYAKQSPRDNAPEGTVRLFLIKNKDDLNKIELESKVIQMMADITGDQMWNRDATNVKVLILEHMMAARRLGFAEFFDVMHEVDKYKQTLLQGLVSDMDIFTKLIFPLVENVLKNDNLSALNLLKLYSPLLRELPQNKAFQILDKCKKVIDILANMDFNVVTIRELITYVCTTHIFVVPEILKRASKMVLNDLTEDDKEDMDIVCSWIKVMDLPVNQIKRFDDYVNRRTMFDTHQGVKGLEFERVLVVIDDNESRGFLFSYDKLLGVKSLSDGDIKNKETGKETSMERTTRLFYVTCTRARNSLAIVMYTNAPETAKETVLVNKWFIDDEIIIIN